MRAVYNEWRAPGVSHTTPPPSIAVAAPWCYTPWCPEPTLIVWQMTDTLTQDEADEILASMAGFGGTPEVSIDDLIEEVLPLTVDDLARGVALVESGEAKMPDYVGIRPLKEMRHSHHKVAQLMATGVDETIVARLCNMSVSYISVLQQDPAFKELIAHYSAEVVDQWADFVGAASDLSMDFLQELAGRLYNEPEKFTVNQINEVLKTLADRSGNAPVSKSVSVSLTANMGDKLAAARQRVNQLLIEGQAQVVSG